MYEKLDIKYVISTMFREKDADVLLSLLDTDPGMQAAAKWIEGLKEWNKLLVDVSFPAYAWNQRLGDFIYSGVRNIQWAFGLGWLSWAAFTPIVNTTVVSRLQKALDEMYREKLLPVNVLTGLLKHGLITSDELKQQLEIRGYSDEDAELYLQYIKQEKIHKDKDLTKTDILRLYREGIIPNRDEAKKMLMTLGYDEHEAELLLSLEDLKIEEEKKKEEEKEKKELEKKLRELTKSDIKKLYILGLIDRDECIKLLQRIGYTGDTLKYIMLLFDYEKDQKEEKAKTKEEKEEIKKERQLTKTDILRLLRYRIIQPEEAKEMLMKIGYSEKDAEYLIMIEIEKEQLKKVPKEEKKNKEVIKQRELTKYDILRAYKKGLLTEDEAIKRLKDIGYKEEDAELLIKSANKELTKSEILTALAEGKITEEEARKRLRRLGYTDETTELLIQMALEEQQED
jgi:hypothetical protein